MRAAYRRNFDKQFFRQGKIIYHQRFVSNRTGDIYIFNNKHCHSNTVSSLSIIPVLINIIIIIIIIIINTIIIITTIIIIFIIIIIIIIITIIIIMLLLLASDSETAHYFV